MDSSDLSRFANGRRLRPEELLEVVRERFGIALVAGFDHLVGGVEMESTRADRPVASAAYLLQAHRIRLTPGARLEWQTAAAPPVVPRGGVVFAFPLACGNGSPLPQPTGHFDVSVDGRYVVSFVVDKRSRRWIGRGGTLAFDAQWVRATAHGDSFTLDEMVSDEASFADGVALLHLPAESVRAGEPSRIRITAAAELDSANWVRVGRMGAPWEHDDVPAALHAVLHAAPRPVVDGLNVLAGDLHNHSGESRLLGREGCGHGSRESLFGYARDLAGLDFFCLSEHDWQMNDDDWRELTELTERYHEAGRFLTLHGYEWTSTGYGHRNVYFREQPDDFLRSRPLDAGNEALDDNPTPRDLWHLLGRAGRPVLTIPHHMSAARFPLSLDEFQEPTYDRVAEIYSGWGDSLEHDAPVNRYALHLPELAFIHAVRKGYRVGFIASSDSHDGHPGNAQGTTKHRHIFHHLGSGRAGVLAEDDSREAIFDALAARRCYAYTGGAMVVSTTLDGHQMGAEVSRSRLSRHPTLRIRADSDSPLRDVVVYRDGYRIDRIGVDDTSTDLDWTDDADVRAGSYFVKVVRQDHEVAWTSPIWIDR